MPSSKRIFDLFVSLLMLCIIWPVIAVCAVLIIVVDRRTPFFAAQRMKGPNRAFTMWKLRTMRGADDGLPTGGIKTSRVTRLGRYLRHWRLDELPQLWNVLYGDMSLVGPRPPTALAVSRYPMEFTDILSVRPGITGLATAALAREEQAVMASAGSSSELEEIYVAKILPCKLEIERFYITNWSLGLDVWILLRSALLILGISNAKRCLSDPAWDEIEAELHRRQTTIETNSPIL